MPTYTYFLLLERDFRAEKAVSEPGSFSRLSGEGSGGSLTGGSEPWGKEWQGSHQEGAEPSWAERENGDRQGFAEIYKVFPMGLKFSPRKEILLEEVKNFSKVRAGLSFIERDIGSPWWSPNHQSLICVWSDSAQVSWLPLAFLFIHSLPHLISTHWAWWWARAGSMNVRITLLRKLGV